MLNETFSVIFKHRAFLAKAYLGIIRHLYVGLSTFTLFIIRTLYILSTISYLPTMKAFNVSKNCVIFGSTLCTFISISFILFYLLLFWSNVKDTFYPYLFVRMLWVWILPVWLIFYVLVLQVYQRTNSEESMSDPEEA